MQMLIFFNQYREAPSDITFDTPMREDLVMTSPKYVSEEEVERIKNLTYEQVLQLINNTI